MLFRDADAVFFFFNLTIRESFENVTQKWIPLFDANVNIMKSHSSFMIVGTSYPNNTRAAVSHKEANELAKLLGVHYLELPSDPVLHMLDLLTELGVVREKDDTIIYLSPTEEPAQQEPVQRCC